MVIATNGGCAHVNLDCVEPNTYLHIL